MDDPQIRASLKQMLMELHAHEDHTIFDELVIDDGKCRADVVLVNGYLNAFEIKSARDTLTRLPSQIESYSACFERLSAVVARVHLKGVREIIPRWWGIIVADEENDQTNLKQIRSPKRNPNVDFESTMRLLWRSELLSVLEVLGIDRGVRSKPISYLWAVARKHDNKEQLFQCMREAIKRRTTGAGKERIQYDGLFRQPSKSLHSPDHRVHSRIVRYTHRPS